MLTRKKDLIRSALRALRVLDGVTFNARMEEAQSIPDVDEEVLILLGEAKARADLFKVEHTMADFTRHLLAAQEPQKALAYLRECRPAGLEDSPHLNAMQTRIERGLRHIHSWDEYKAFYGTPTYFSTFDISRGTVRGQIALETVKREQPKHILGIGPNDGLLERRLLDASPEAKLVVCEIASTFDTVLGNLVEEYPGRVAAHPMNDFYDWAPRGALFDLIVMFEVLEHVPNEVEAVLELADLCQTSGTVLVSVPVGYKYVEAQRADDAQFQHVRAFTADTLRETLLMGFKTVAITEGADRTYVATCKDPRGFK